MIRIDAIREAPNVLEYLRSRGIIEQYQKTKQMLIGGFPQKYDFKLRQPKNSGIYQFRINQKYRAFGFFKSHTFIVTLINDHQDF